MCGHPKRVIVACALFQLFQGRTIVLVLNELAIFVCGFERASRPLESFKKANLL
jgi:hypothetical protein